WFELWRPLSMATGAGERHIRQLEARHDTPEHQSPAAHVAAADEVGWKHQAVAEDRQQQIDVLARRDAAEQHDFAVRPNRLAQRRRGPLERVTVRRVAKIDVSRREAAER